MATAALTRYTPEEYLALERHAEFRSEYIDGSIIAMTGAQKAISGDPAHSIGWTTRWRSRPWAWRSR